MCLVKGVTKNYIEAYKWVILSKTQKLVSQFEVQGK